VLVVVACLALARAGAPSPVIDRIMAVVQGEIVTLSDVNAAIGLGIVRAAAGADPVAAALELLIERRLQLIEVDRYAPPEPDPREVEARVAALRARLGPDLPRRLAAYGLTETQLRQIARDDLRLATYLEQRFASVTDPTEEEVRRYYREHAQEFVRDGVPQPLSEVEEEVRRRIEAARRAALIEEWSRSLRLRADVLVIPAASGGESR